MTLTFHSPLPNFSQLQREAFANGRRHVAIMVSQLHREGVNGECIQCLYKAPCPTMNLITPFLPSETPQQ